MRDDDGAKLSFTAFRDILRSTGRVAGIIWKEKKWLVVGLFLVLLVLSAVPFLGSGSRGLLINELVRSVGAGAFTPALVWLTAFAIAVGFLFPITNGLQFYLLKQFWFFLEEKFTTMMLRKKGDIDVAVHENPKYNDLFTRVRETGIWRVQNFSDRQFFLFQNALEVAVSAVVLFFAGPLVLILLIISSIPELVIEVRYGRDIWGIWSARAELRRRFFDLQHHFEWLPYLTELKLFQNTGHFVSLIRTILSTFHSEQRALERRKLIYELTTSLISQVAGALVIVWLVLQVVRGTIQIGTFTFFIASIAQLRQSLSGLFGNLGRQYEDGLFVKDIFTLLDIPPALPRTPKSIALAPHRTPEIRFEGITFTYPGTDKPALKNFTLTIPPGEKLALVGANGAGKTTLVKLLSRFYDPDKGRIVIDGHDLKTIDLESWHRHLGVLFQDYSKYHFIVKEAIALGRTGIQSSLEKVKDAAKASEADIFIEEWEKQYKQMLGKQFTGGVEPSIGQWQKLALARTFYRDPRILILDEPTSSIDAEAEAKIFEKLEALPKDRTVILISHRFSTVRQANRICVLKDGALKELGTHRELLKIDGIYARLFRLQAKGYQ
jgi:ATP-binding cassette subfamily B protein/ATP-binding cassette subfamily C protein